MSGLITNIQKVHLEGLGSLERLKEEKGELFRRMKRDGTIVVNHDDPRVVDLAGDFPGQQITFGIEEPSDVMAREIRLRGIKGTSFTLIVEGEATEITLPLLGRHFVPDALSAIAIAALFGIDLERVKEVLEHFRPAPMRMEVLSLGHGKVLINDAYNANPRSMEMALETLAEVKGGGRAIAVLGDMLELGNCAEEAHLQLGRKVGELSIDLLLAMGEWAPVVVESAVRHGIEPERTKILESHGEAISLLRRVIQEGDWVLIKGSRRMAMEKIVEGLDGREGVRVLYHLLYPLHTVFSFFNVFRYITFRTIYAILTALLISFVIGPWLIRKLKAFQMQQVVREDVPARHLVKNGTPTMGGSLIIAAIAVPTLLWSDLTNPYVWIVLLTDPGLWRPGFFG